jgi:hypothetical protein
VSDPRLLKQDAIRLKEFSATLRERSAATSIRSDWLIRKSQELQLRMEEQAARWAAFESARREGGVNRGALPSELADSLTDLARELELS